MKKQTRLEVYQKYNGHCAYCGKEIEYKNMQVDHIVPKRLHSNYHDIDNIKNLNPSCRRCNHYKRATTLERFRVLMQTMHLRIRDNYICKVAEDYGIIQVKEWDGTFYFERLKETGGRS